MIGNYANWWMTTNIKFNGHGRHGRHGDVVTWFIRRLHAGRWTMMSDRYNNTITSSSIWPHVVGGTMAGRDSRINRAMTDGQGYSVRSVCMFWLSTDADHCSAAPDTRTVYPRATLFRSAILRCARPPSRKHTAIAYYMPQIELVSMLWRGEIDGTMTIQYNDSGSTSWSGSCIY